MGTVMMIVEEEEAVAGTLAKIEAYSFNPFQED